MFEPNPKQLSTETECKQIADKLGYIGGGVEEWYVPRWIAFFDSINNWFHSSPEIQSGPEAERQRHWHFRFKNGAEGFNVGLIRETIKNNPNSWPVMISSEVNSAARKGD